MNLVFFPILYSSILCSSYTIESLRAAACDNVSPAESLHIYIHSAIPAEEPAGAYAPVSNAVSSA